MTTTYVPVARYVPTAAEIARSKALLAQADAAEAERCAEDRCGECGAILHQRDGARVCGPCRMMRDIDGYEPPERDEMPAPPDYGDGMPC